MRARAVGAPRCVLAGAAAHAPSVRRSPSRSDRTCRTCAPTASPSSSRPRARPPPRCAPATCAWRRAARTTRRSCAALPQPARARYRVAVDGADAGGGEVVAARRRAPAHVRRLRRHPQRRRRRRRAGQAGRAAGRPTSSSTPATSRPTAATTHGWAAFFADEHALLADVPLYPTLGNHEIFRDPDAHALPPLLRAPRRRPRAALLPVSLRPRAPSSSSTATRPRPTQTAWLRGTLEAAERDGVRPRVRPRAPAALVARRPLRRGARARPTGCALFEAYGVRAVFAGHDHAYERMERRGVRYFVSGGGGAPVYRRAELLPTFDRAAKRMYRPATPSDARARRRRRASTSRRSRVADGAPIDDVRFSVGEPAFAMDAPPLSPEREARAQRRSAVDARRRRRHASSSSASAFGAVAYADADARACIAGTRDALPHGRGTQADDAGDGRGDARWADAAAYGRARRPADAQRARTAAAGAAQAVACRRACAPAPVACSTLLRGEKIFLLRAQRDSHLSDDEAAPFSARGA